MAGSVFDEPAILSMLTQVPKYLVGMVGGNDGIVNLGDVTVGIDQKTMPGGIRLVRLNNAVGRARNLIGIAEQVIRKVELFLESAIILWGIERGAQDHCVLRRKVLDSITEPIAFNGSARCVGLGIPPQHHVMATILLQCRDRAVLITHGKGRRQIPYF